jgi:hypothetical protein
MPRFISRDGADGTYHNAGPAADASIKVYQDIARAFVFTNASRNTGNGACGIIAIPALDCDGTNSIRHSLFINRLDVNSGTVKLMDGGTSQFTGPACHALFNSAKDTFHKMPYLRLRVLGP